MTASITSPVTGGAQTGFTSPTYTLILDSSVSNSKRWVVSAVGGTQAGVETHTASKQFAIETVKPVVIKQLGAPAANGIVANVPVNRYMVKTMKSVLPAVSQLPKGMSISTEFNIPAGSETYDTANIKAAISLHIGALTQLSAGLGDTVVSGVL